MAQQLGEILVQKGAVSLVALRTALDQQRVLGLPLGKTLLRDRLCAEDDLWQALAEQSGLPYLALDEEPIDPAAARLLPAKFARERRVVPLRLEQGRHEVLHVAMAAPVLLPAVDDVRAVSGKARLKAFVASDAAIARALLHLYQPRAPRNEAGAEVLLYGFNYVDQARLDRHLSARGLKVRTVGPREVMTSERTDLLLASLSALENLVPRGERLLSNIVAVGSDPERDLAKAQQLGARGFLTTPVDVELLLRTLRRFRPTDA